MPLIQTLRNSLNVGTVPETIPSKPEMSNCLQYAIWRCLTSWSHARRFGPDEAVLLRQVVRWAERDLFVGSLPDDISPFFPSTGLSLSPDGYLSASPFVPSWSTENGRHSRSEFDRCPKLRRLDESRSAEPFLGSLGYKAWQSQAQKEATWRMLTAPPGSTTLVALPTGSGKSLCFQTVAKFSTGLTIVVVPTIALAIDQWRSAKHSLESVPGMNPLYFASDDSEMDPESVAEAVREGRTRLVFTSPEACVSGRLRNLIKEFAASGRLSNLVVDEAHIIETWGIYFRVDFQLLSSLQSQWRLLSGNSMRTYLLSATFTANTRNVLKDLFADGVKWQEFISQRLRPEIQYFRSRFTGQVDQELALFDCVWKLPRPAIIYTTEVDAAKKIFTAIRSLGFSRVACFTGETRPAERRRLLADWGADKIDLVVGTSAFGLGVDKSDVRTVIHACMPENLHRYYQEVGRGGRDGFSSTAILLTSKRDIEIAKGMAPKLLTKKVAQQRWSALRDSALKDDEENHIFLLNTAARREDLIATRTYKENVRWNKRLILQMLRARKLDLIDIERIPSEERNGERDEWVRVRLRFSPDDPNVIDSLEEFREDEIKTLKEGLEQMLEYLNGRHPICWLLKKLYGPEVQRVCGGCSDCRSQNLPFAQCGPLEFETSTQSGVSTHTLISSFPDFQDVRDTMSRRQLLRKLVGVAKIRRFAVAPEFFELVLKCFADAFGPESTELFRLDPLSADIPIIFGEEPLVVFHVGNFNSATTHLRTGSDVINIVSRGVPILEHSGRFIGEADGWTHIEGVENWMEQKSFYVY